MQESLISLKKNYAPLFGKEQAVLNITFFQEFDLETSSDTSLYLMFQVNQRTTEVAGYSLGLSLFSSDLFGGASSVAGGGSYNYQRESGTMVMTYPEFVKLYQAVNKTYTYITTKKKVRGSNRESIVTYRPNEVITFAGEYTPDNLTRKERFFIHLDQATFTLDIMQFEEVAKVLSTIRQVWSGVIEDGK